MYFKNKKSIMSLIAITIMNAEIYFLDTIMSINMQDTFGIDP